MTITIVHTGSDPENFATTEFSQSTQVSCRDMDVFDGPYYRINKTLLTCLGLWPYQKSSHKRFIRIAIFFLAVSIVVPEICQLIDVWGDLDHIIEVVSMLGCELSISMKFSNYILHADKVKVLTDRIYNDWKFNIIGPQLDVIRSNADKGRKLTEFYSVYMYFTLVMYLMMPLAPKFLDIVVPLNESRIIEFPLPAKYGDLNTDAYFLPILLHHDCISILSITTIVAMDSTYAVYVQHACGLFAALGDKLERLVDVNANAGAAELDHKRQEEMTYREVVSCVKMHKDAIEFAEIIESSHTALFFCVIGLTVFCMSVAGYQMVMNLDKPSEAFRFAAFTIAQVAHIYFISWPGQKLMDHSARIHEWAYGVRWYEVSSRSKKLLLLMMLRSDEPCRLTAGKIYIMSLANFSMIVRTSVSYFTVLTSFR